MITCLKLFERIILKQERFHVIPLEFMAYFFLPLFIVEFLKTCTSHIENADDFNWPFKKLRDKKYTVYYRITQLDTHSTINLPAQKYIVWSFNDKNA